jgi:hypothetical protein
MAAQLSGMLERSAARRGLEGPIGLTLAGLGVRFLLGWR